MATHTLAATPRTVLGRKVNQLRRSGSIPAVIYGHGVPARSLTVSAVEFQRLERSAPGAALLDLAIEGGAPVKALLQEVARHPVHGQVVHIDFREVSMTEEVETQIPLRFTGTAPVLSDGSYVLVKQLDHLDVRALPGALVEEIVIDLASLVTGDDLIAIRDIALPPGITAEHEPEDIVVSVTEVQEEAVAPVAEVSPADVPVVEKKEKAKEDEGSEK
ncbi:50S ribosomal protein L25 [Candidatus Uhrbacteria bacterium]|nr:50S ribosomal protein L25 [Candidatus Uhrbacteria bacterium]